MRRGSERGYRERGESWRGKCGREAETPVDVASDRQYGPPPPPYDFYLDSILILILILPILIPIIHFSLLVGQKNHFLHFHRIE